MRELRFAKMVYLGEDIDAALGVYERFGKLEREDDATHWIVRVSAASPAKERTLAGELCNYALGLGMRRGVR